MVKAQVASQVIAVNLNPMAAFVGVVFVTL
jgi:hypothetical protein